MKIDTHKRQRDGHPLRLNGSLQRAASLCTTKLPDWATSAVSDKMAVITQKSVLAYSDSMPHIRQQSVPGGTVHPYQARRRCTYTMPFETTKG